jgi:hypothetical protein
MCKSVAYVNVVAGVFGASLLALPVTGQDAPGLNIVRTDDRLSLETNVIDASDDFYTRRFDAAFRINRPGSPPSAFHVDVSFSREAVPGANLLTIFKGLPRDASDADRPSLGSESFLWRRRDQYRYLGHEGNVIRFEHTSVGLEGLNDLLDEQSVISLYSARGSNYIFVPEAFQYTGLYFEVVASPEDGIIRARLLQRVMSND